MLMTDCIEIPADAVLRDGTSTDATVLVFYRHEFEARPFWLVDRDGSCARFRAKRGRPSSRVWYEWHPQMAPYHGETKSELF
jgi:hypothetical protein